MITQNQLLPMNVLSKVTNVHLTADVTELVNPGEIQRKLLFALLTGDIANVPQLIGRSRSRLIMKAKDYPMLNYIFKKI